MPEIRRAALSSRQLSPSIHIAQFPSANGSELHHNSVNPLYIYLSLVACSGAAGGGGGGAAGRLLAQVLLHAHRVRQVGLAVHANGLLLSRFSRTATPSCETSVHKDADEAVPAAPRHAAAASAC